MTIRYVSVNSAAVSAGFLIYFILQCVRYSKCGLQRPRAQEVIKEKK